MVASETEKEFVVAVVVTVAVEEIAVATLMVRKSMLEGVDWFFEESRAMQYVVHWALAVLEVKVKEMVLVVAMTVVAVVALTKTRIHLIH